MPGEGGGGTPATQDADGDAEGGQELAALLSSATLVFVGTVLNRATGLVEYVILGRALSTDVYGVVTVSLAVMSLTTTVALLGFSQGIPRYMSRMDQASDRRGVWLTGFGIAMGVAILLGVGLYANADTLARALVDHPGGAAILRPFLLAIPLFVGFRVGIAGIRGLEHTVYKTYVADLLYPLGRVGVILGLLALGFGGVAAGYSYLCMAGATFLAAHFLLDKLLGLVGPVRLHTRELVGFSAPLVVSSVLSLLLMHTDTLMLGYFRSSHATGMYGYVYPLSTGLLFVITAFGFLYLPLTARLDADDRRGELDAVYRVTTRWIFLATFPLFLTFVVFPTDVLVLVFGERAGSASPALVVLSIGFFCNATFGRNHDTLTALGATTLVLISNVVAFATNILLNLALIPSYGVVGAAIASAASYVTLNLVDFVLLRWQFDISPFAPRTRRLYLAVPLVVLPVAAMVSRAITLTVVTLPVVLVCAGLLAVGVAAGTGSLSSEDELLLTVAEEKLGRRLPYLRQLLRLSTG
jgi:O-antigen/teichoic acid export membrane protein